jgi:hypothetical protein
MTQIQFMHIETYAKEISGLASNRGKKNTVDKVINEALRVEGFCSHIAAPQPAIRIHGHPVEELQNRLNALLATKGQSVISQNGDMKIRAVRKDAHVLLGAIYSYPVEKKDVDRGKMNQFFHDCIDFHKNQFGTVDSALLHTDETYYHIHVYTLSANAKRLHPGHAVNEQRKKDKSVTLTYRKAMSVIQDRFYDSVASQHGMARLGPKRQRLKRDHYLKVKSEKEEERLYSIELEEKKKAKLKELDDKLSEAERQYLSSIERYKYEMQQMKDEIDFTASSLADMKQLKERVYQLMHELATKDAKLAEYEYEYDSVRPR